MQVDGATVAKYQKASPDLFAAIEADITGDFIMKKDAQTGFCVKFEDGKCGVQIAHGEAMLGDACFFYPRITRMFGDGAVMTATMSCPEIARIALFEDGGAEFVEVDFVRLPVEIKNVLPDEITKGDALEIHNVFIASTEDKNASVEQIFLRINSVVNSLQLLDKKDWLGAIPMYFRFADGRLPTPQKNINNPFNLLHALCGLVVASKKSPNPRLAQIISDIEKSLDAKLDWKNVLIATSDNSLEASNNLQKIWHDEMQEKYQPLLKKWLSAHLSASLFPFAGLGETMAQRATIIGVRLATLKLALTASYNINGELADADIVKIVQSLSRFLEHLASPTFSLQIYAEAGWSKEASISGLLQ